LCRHVAVYITSPPNINFQSFMKSLIMHQEMTMECFEILGGEMFGHLRNLLTFAQGAMRSRNIYFVRLLVITIVMSDERSSQSLI
jgi:hypothetical protein